MIGLEMNPVIQGILQDPTSDLYAEARGTLRDHSIRETIDLMGLAAAVTPFARYELGWVLGMIDAEPGVMEMLTEALHSALEAGLPIIFKWEYRKASCAVFASVAGGKAFITLGTPALDQEELPAMFSGGYGASLKLLTS